MKYTFAFTSNPIIIHTVEELNKSTSLYIETLLNIAISELTHTVHNSSAYRFNESRPDHTILVSPEFIAFMHRLVNFLGSVEQHNLQEIFKGDNITFEDFVIDTENNVVIKKKAFHIDTLNILSILVLEEIKEYLQTMLKSSFSIEHNTHFVTHGNTIAKWSYVEDDGVLYEGFPAYSVISLFVDPDWHKKTQGDQGFASADRFLQPRHYIISAPTFKNVYSHYFKLKDLKYESEFLEYLRNHEVALSIIHADKTLETLRG